jgi:hypothetical protein
MRRVSLSQATRMYRCGEMLAIHYHQIDHGPFGQFCRLYRQCMKDLGELSRDAYWLGFCRSIRWYRFRLSSVPLPFNHPSIVRELDIEAMERVSITVDKVYPSHAKSARGILVALRGLIESGDNPLLDVVKELMGAQVEDIALVIGDSRLEEQVAGVMAAQVESPKLKCLSASEYRRSLAMDRIILTGPARWFPEYVFQAPRAPRIDLVSYSWERSKWRGAQVFTGLSQPSANMPRSDSFSTETELLSDAWPEIDWSELALGLKQPVGDGAIDLSDQVDAIPFGVYGGWIFLECGEAATSLIIDTEADGRDVVRRLKTKEIATGMYILVRTDGADDYVVQVADRLLGNRAVEYRAAQQRWKVALREKVKESGLLVVSIQLLDCGSRRAEEANLRHWISDRSIGTQDDRDFAAILRLVGLEDEADYFRLVARGLRAAHLRCGMLIRKKLLEQVKSVNIGELDRVGRMDFEIREAEGVRLTAFRVERRGPSSVCVGAARLGRLLSLNNEVFGF